MTTASDLRKIPSLREYAEDELEVLAAAAPRREFPAGAMICKEGTAGQSCFLLLSGEVEVLKGELGADHVIAKLGAGAFVGQIALVDRRPRTASVRAATPTVACELSRDVFERLLSAQSPLAMRFQTQIAIAAIRQLRAATDRFAKVMGAQAGGPSKSRPPPPDARAFSRIQATFDEWDLSADELDAVEVVTPDGIGNRGAGRPSTKAR